MKNGLLTFELIMEGYKNIGKRGLIIEKVPKALTQAIQITKEYLRSPNKESRYNNIDIIEFPSVLGYMYQYFEYLELFMGIDKDRSGTITNKEFRKGLPLMKKYGLNIHDPDAEFMVL
jgi:Ca2+-binding EF-hand superfamily protein